MTARVSCFQTLYVVKPDGGSIGVVPFAQAVFLGFGVQELAMDSKATRGLGAIAFRLCQRLRDHAAFKVFHGG
jgi:hypothetical protein